MHCPKSPNWYAETLLELSVIYISINIVRLAGSSRSVSAYIRAFETIHTNYQTDSTLRLYIKGDNKQADYVTIMFFF